MTTVKQLSSEEYIRQRDLIIDQYEKQNISEEICIRKLQNLYAKRVPLYRNGGEGFILWAEENVRVLAYLPGTSILKPTYLADLSREPEPMTGRTWWDFWCWQKDICRQALKLDTDGRLKHNLVVFCTERGEGKSFMAVLILLWKFTVFANQRIFLAANSKEQSSFAHREEMDKIIRISPVLLALVGGEKNIQKKELAIYDSRGLKISFITTVSTFTGVLSNATGFSFSEFFQARPDAPFFNEIYTSMRNTPNALGVIDSTVSTRDHKLYKLYEAIQKGAKGTDSWFFYYKCNPTADVNKYMSPANTQKQLDAFQASTAANPVEFDMFFKNTWDTAQKGLFSEELVDACHYLGASGKLLNQQEIMKQNETLTKHVSDIAYADYQGFGKCLNQDIVYFDKKALKDIDEYIAPLNEVAYYAPADAVAKLGDLLDTDWAIGLGLDRSDPLATRSSAQTVLTCVAKGLPGSRSNPQKFIDISKEDYDAPDYVHVLIGIHVSNSSNSNDLQKIISGWADEYSGIESFSSDRYGVSDLAGWLTSEEIVEKPEVVHFSQQKQQEVFSILYNTVAYGRFKMPRIHIVGAKESDILVEQLKNFSVTYDGRKVTYGSPDKKHIGAIQDDAVDALAMAVYGMRYLGLDDFRSVDGSLFFGTYIPPQ
jgi:hypothetical protein